MAVSFSTAPQVGEIQGFSDMLGEQDLYRFIGTM
jgi:hypothetical protein